MIEGEALNLNQRMFLNMAVGHVKIFYKDHKEIIKWL